MSSESQQKVSYRDRTDHHSQIALRSPRCHDNVTYTQSEYCILLSGTVLINCIKRHTATTVERRQDLPGLGTVQLPHLHQRNTLYRDVVDTDERDGKYVTNINWQGGNRGIVGNFRCGGA